MGVTSRGGVWYVKWRDYAGRWKRRATKATTKKQAQVIYAALVSNADRQRHGLDPLPIESGMTVWDLCQWWLTTHAKKASRRRNISMLTVHVRRTDLGALPLKHLRSSEFDARFAAMERDGYKPRTINQLRLVLMGVFTKGADAGHWHGANPLKKTQAREVPKIPHPVPVPEELELIIGAVPANWRGFFATAGYLGLRKGELCGLLKTDYDARLRTLYVGRSYDAETTKGKRIDFLPVTPALAAHLDEAMKSPGRFLFPAPDGEMRSENAGPEDILRAALRRLGMVEGWLHKCRRCVRGQTRSRAVAIEAGRARALVGESKGTWVLAQDDEPRRCKKCSFKLWPVGIPRRMTFHTMRHACATHLLQAGVPIQHVQRVLRHSSITLTIDTYGHLVTEDLRSALEKLGPRPVHGVQVDAKTRAG